MRRMLVQGGTVRNGHSTALNGSAEELLNKPSRLTSPIQRCGLASPVCCTALWSLMAQSVTSRQRSNRSLSGVKRTSGQLTEMVENPPRRVSSTGACLRRYRLCGELSAAVKGTFRKGMAPFGTIVVGREPFHFSACVSWMMAGLSASALARAAMAVASALPLSTMASACACASARTELARPFACVTAMSALIFS